MLDFMFHVYMGAKGGACISLMGRYLFQCGSLIDTQARIPGFVLLTTKSTGVDKGSHKGPRKTYEQFCLISILFVAVGMRLW